MSNAIYKMWSLKKLAKRYAKGDAKDKKSILVELADRCVYYGNPLEATDRFWDTVHKHSEYDD